MLIIQRTGKGKFGCGAPRHIVLQRCKLLLPFGFVPAHFRQYKNSQPRAVVGKFHDRYRSLIIFRLGIIGEGRKANPFHAHEQAVCRGCGGAKYQSASRDFIHSGKFQKKLTSPGSSAAEARAAAAWLLRALRALPVPRTAATAPPPKPAIRVERSRMLPAPCRQNRCSGSAYN